MIKIFIIILLVINFNAFAELNKENNSQFLYRKLSRLYVKWDEGLYGSRNFYKWEIIRLLRDSYGKEIISGYDFILIKPYEVGKQKFICKFWYGQWLQLRGIVSKKNLLKIVIKNNKKTRWWRSSVLVAIKGRIRKFYLNRTKNGRCIIIHLDKLEIINK